MPIPWPVKSMLMVSYLRRPSVHTMFQVPNGVGGLSDALRSSRGPLSLIEISPNLTILPGGKPDNNPMAGLTSERMKTILDEAAERFDCVLVDTPPAVLLPDAQLLARLIDAVLLVIAAGSTPFALLQRTVNEFGADRIIGTVLNRVTEGITPAAYYGGYYRPTTAANSGR
jgi:Mrp family chromosome partitioning ATPase